MMVKILNITSYLSVYKVHKVIKTRTQQTTNDLCPTAGERAKLHAYLNNKFAKPRYCPA
jgi:hypothetical protein